MKKLIALLATVSIAGTMAFSAFSVSADETFPLLISASDTNTVTGISDGASLTFESESDIILSGYENGVLKYSSLYKPQDGKITVTDDVSKYDLKVFFVDSQNIASVKVKIEATPAPEVTPEPTEKPILPTPTPVPNNPNKFPPVYEKAVNAVEAFSVVDTVAEEMYESTKGYKLTYYFQGKECSDWLGEDITIVSAPDNAAELIDENVNVLRRGDIIYINRKMDGSVRNIGLIYQSQKNDIVNNSEDFGESFQKLYSVNGTAVAGCSAWSVLNYGQKPATKGTQYAFGVIARRENTALYLINKTGNLNNSLLLSMADSAMVYECDMSRTKGITVTRPLSVISTIPNVTWNKAMGSDGIISLSDKGYNYALARIVDGTVMDITIYTNY